MRIRFMQVSEKDQELLEAKAALVAGKSMILEGFRMLERVLDRLDRGVKRDRLLREYEEG